MWNTSRRSRPSTFGSESYILSYQWFYLLDSDLVGYHLGITPILAYGWFFWTSRKYNEGLSSATKNNTTIGLIVLSLTLVFVVGLFIWSDRESSWTYENNQLEIQGPYSISLNISDLDSISLLESLPVITIRSHGISTGKVAGQVQRTQQNALPLTH